MKRKPRHTIGISRIPLINQLQPKMGTLTYLLNLKKDLNLLLAGSFALKVRSAAETTGFLQEGIILAAV
jgi:hypothetical protein